MTRRQHRTLAVGDLVNFGGGSVPWEVISIQGQLVEGRSTRSGRRRTYPLRFTFWHGTNRCVLPREPESDGYHAHPDGSVVIDGDTVRSPDVLVATVTCWDGPAPECGTPSSVGVNLTRDRTERNFIKVIASGPRRAAYLDRDSAVNLAADVLRLAALLPSDPAD